MLAQTLYIYGNSNDIDISSTSLNGAPMHNDAKNVKLTISHITNPYAKFSSYGWTVKTMRFQTKTIIESTSTVTTNISTTHGTIANSSYASSWGVSNTDIPEGGAIVFMDASFTIGNPVYNSNTATIVFSDQVDGTFPTSGSNTAVDCWMTEAHLMSGSTYTACTSTASTVTVSNLKASGVNTQFKFRVLATLNTSSSTACTITSAKTMDGSATTIDETTSNLASLTRASSTDLINEAASGEWGIGLIVNGSNADYAKTAGGVTGLNVSNAAAFRVRFVSTLAFSNTTVVTIKLPLNTSASSNYHWFASSTNARVQIGTGATVAACNTTADPTLGVIGEGTTTGVTSAMTANTSGLGKVTITFATPTVQTLKAAALASFCVQLD